MNVGESWGRLSRPKLDVLQSTVTSIIMEWTFSSEKSRDREPDGDSGRAPRILRADTKKF